MSWASELQFQFSRRVSFRRLVLPLECLEVFVEFTFVQAFYGLIHTCELNKANPFEYLTELLRHPVEMKASPAEWMPWNYRETLARSTRPVAA
jgi:hypothetical protein